MPPFKGFPEGKAHLIPIPAQFFEELLPQIDHLDELKVTLYTFWRLEHMEGVFRYLRRSDFTQDVNFMHGLGETTAEAQTALDEALKLAVERGALLQARLPLESGEETGYFVNSPKGRAAIRAIESGQWRPGNPAPASAAPEPANIFRLYEENIGPLTPLIADALREAEDTYPADWIEEAIQIAIEKNKRNWRYIEAILERWQREKRHDKKNQPQNRHDSAEDRRKYIEGEFSEFIKH